MIVRHVALAGKKVGLTVAVQVDHRHRVSLRPGIVDDVFRPLVIRPLFHPKNAIIVRC